MHSSPQAATASHKLVKPIDLEAGKLFLMPPTQWSYAFFVKRRIIEQWQGWETLEDYGLVQVHSYNISHFHDGDFFLVVDACCLVRSVHGLHVIGLWNDKLVAIPRDKIDTHLIRIEERERAADETRNPV
ncbi:MAG: hypothetical protein WC761_00330 [Candidatus Paceibacterota bacterium]|jgi:hypothetical protein